MNGKHLEYDKEGIVRLMCNFIDNRLHGIRNEFSKEGIVTNSSEWINGISSQEDGTYMDLNGLITKIK